MHIQKKGGRFYGSFLLLMALFIIFPKWLSATTLHAILIGDTNDSKIGRSVEVDLGKIANMLRSIEDATKTKLVLNSILVMGSDIASGRGYDKVTEVIAGLQVKADEVVIFYYSGHGINEIPPWPSMGVEGRMGVDRLAD